MQRVLTDKEVIQCTQLYMTGKYTYHELELEFGVGGKVIWANVQRYLEKIDYERKKIPQMRGETMKKYLRKVGGQIKSKYKKRYYSMKMLSDEYGISQSTIFNLIYE